ncbi:tachykinin-like peptides receptor 86C isoform X1 [Macrosteles quadrilineatus]|uniref:tachykinin-like peptides receptor 86C isoform X1 n=1 Tax=Macrosteles quadrilineatus TaxID=74068 RepID=UPI0023E11100|nr:tachykinin-like peptides receptor 86C isoform X1 [Macrosteles quadrilineatus]
MGDIDFAKLYNCTALLLDKDPFVNVSSVWALNRTQVLSVLGPVFDDQDDTLTSGRRSGLKDFLTDCVYPPLQRPTDLLWWQKVVWSSVFAIMLLVATGGNSIVMWIVLAHRRMRTVTNYFLVNLSVSDLMMALLNCIFNFIFMLNSHWPFGSFYCTVNNFVANVTVAASVFTLVAISIDRYMAIVRPLQHRMSRCTARAAIAVIWIASALLAFPCLLYSSTMVKRYRNGQTRTVCYMMWPDGRYPFSMAEYVYNLVFLSLTYLVPVVAMAVCYTLMGRELWGSKSIGEQTQRQLDAIKSKRKVVRMFIIVVTIFALCWLPYHGYFIYAYHNNSVAASKYVQHIYLFFYWLAMSNAMVNPLIYYWMNNRFRVYFRQIICQCFCFRPSLKHELELPTVKHGGSQSDVVGRSRSGKGRWSSTEIHVYTMATDHSGDASPTPGSEVSSDPAYNHVAHPSLPRSPCKWQLSLQLARAQPAAPPRATSFKY